MIGRLTRAALMSAMLAGNGTAYLEVAPSHVISTPSHIEAQGGGLTEKLICIGCVTAGILILGTGAASWSLLVANPALTAAAVSECIYACSVAY